MAWNVIYISILLHGWIQVVYAFVLLSLSLVNFWLECVMTHEPSLHGLWLCKFVGKFADFPLCPFQVPCPTPI